VIAVIFREQSTIWTDAIQSGDVASTDRQQQLLNDVEHQTEQHTQLKEDSETKEELKERDPDLAEHPSAKPTVQHIRERPPPRLFAFSFEQVIIIVVVVVVVVVVKCHQCGFFLLTADNKRRH
jgi:formylmethanofuran dehydrogenase subunit E